MKKDRDRTSAHMTARARSLRRQTTFPERLLWSRLRNRRCGGIKFRRQCPVGPYVVDFLCESAALAIELDGRSHDEQAADYDQQRQAYLEEAGLTVIRFTNDRLLQNLDEVVEIIEATCRAIEEDAAS